ncbi:hypothetical protein WA158_001914 [Blastocystis sp. Blastoise]
MFANTARRFFATAKPYRILGVQHVAIGGPSKAALQKLWVDIFGLTNVKTFKSAKENVNEDILHCGKGPLAVEVDIMECFDPAKKPNVASPPLNHLGLWVDDLPACVESLQSQGVRFAPGGIRPGAAGYNITFLHPKGNEKAPICGEGVLIELVQAPKDVIEYYDKL